MESFCQAVETGDNILKARFPSLRFILLFFSGGRSAALATEAVKRRRDLRRATTIRLISTRLVRSMSR